MPELPDVENFRRIFYHTSLNKKVIEVKELDTQVVSGISIKSLKGILKGSRFITTNRYGKYLFVKTDRNNWLVLHFGMTGRFIYQKNKNNIPDHTRAYFEFEESAIAYICVRKFGKIFLVDSKDQFIKQKNLGPDALDMKLETFMEKIKSKKKIKSALLDQSVIAGIGNIYSDEILFQSGVHPKTNADKLDHKAVKRIYSNISKILKIAIDKKVDIDKFPDSWIVHKREKNTLCPGNCKGKIKRIKINNRSTYFCPSCQKLYK
jgi:formamidopyrimidine-DNA glycosylase